MAPTIPKKSSGKTHQQNRYLNKQCKQNTDKDKPSQDIIAWKQPVWFASNFATPSDKQGF